MCCWPGLDHVSLDPESGSALPKLCVLEEEEKQLLKGKLKCCFQKEEEDGYWAGKKEMSTATRRTLEPSCLNHKPLPQG